MQDFDQILQEIYPTFFLQDLLYLAIKASFLVPRLARYVQDLVQDLASLARKILARFAYFLQDDFYWAVTNSSYKLPTLANVFSNPKIYWRITTAEVVHATNSGEHVTSYQNS